MPTTTELGGISLTTTELAPILVLSPIVMGPRIFAPCADNNIVADRGMSLYFLPRCSTQRNAVVESDIIADFGRLANDNTHAVVNKEPFADLRSGVYLNTGQKPAHVRSKSPYKKHLMLPEPMPQPVKQNRVKTRITEQDLKDTPGRRIAFKN